MSFLGDLNVKGRPFITASSKKNRMGKNRKRFEGTPKTMERPHTDEADRKEVEAPPRSKRTFRKAVILALNYTCNLQSGGGGAAAAYQF